MFPVKFYSRWVKSENMRGVVVWCKMYNTGTGRRSEEITAKLMRGLEKVKISLLNLEESKIYKLIINEELLLKYNFTLFGNRFFVKTCTSSQT